MTSQCSSSMDIVACVSAASFEVKSDHCVIDRLLRQPFRKLSFAEKSNIISEGQPRQTLNVTTQLKRCVRYFKRSIYESDHWICGCEVLNRLFCWPCLLFSHEKSVWNCAGFSDLNNIYKASKRHKDSANHIKCEKELHLFRRGARIAFSLSEQDRISIEQHNQTVKQNREMLGHLISAACFLGKQGLAFRGHDKNSSSNNKGNYMELFNEFVRIDGVLKSHLENSTLLRGTFFSIQNDLIFSIAEVISATVKKEILETPFVALIIDESSDVAMESQMSTILRYTTKEGLVERFIAFSDDSCDKSAYGLLQNSLQIMNEFECGSKLIAQTYDGAAIMASEHNGFQATLRSHFKSAVFVHCYAHKLNLVLSQSASFIKEVKLFFINISGFSIFFSKSSKRTHALDLIVKQRLPSISATEWNFHSCIVETISSHKVDLECLFEAMVENKDSEWDTDTVVYAGGLLNMLKDFDFNFFIMLFSAIFPHSDTLFNVLQKKLSDIDFCNRQIQIFVKHIENLRNNFEKFWMGLDEFVKESSLPSKRSQNVVPGEDIKAYKLLYDEILEVIRLNIDQRFYEHSKLKFMGLLDSSQFSTFSNSFPEDILESLQESYGQYFDFLRLKGELSVVYKDKDMRKSLTELHQHIIAMELFSIFPETTKLIQLITTIPVTTITEEKSSSCLERIKNYLRNSQDQERLSALALMHIENGLLERLRSTPQFQEDVIEVFIRKTQRTDLQFKK